MAKPAGPSFWLTAAVTLLAASTSMIRASPIVDTLLHASASGDSNSTSNAEPTSIVSQPIFWIKIIVIILLVAGSGIVAGLTLGLMSIDETNLRILSTSGNAKQKRYAARIMPIRKNGHLLLVTLLLANTLINETLPVLFDSIWGGGIISVVVSTALLVIFSEIIPQAVCSQHGLAIGAFFAWPVRILTWVLFVIAWPIAKLLDLLLGTNHGMIYRRAELKELIALHSESFNAGGDLEKDAVTILQGALEMQDKTVREAMTPIDNVLMLNFDEILNRKTLNRLAKAGHSRIPVYKIIGGAREGQAGEDNPKGSGPSGNEREKATKEFREDKEIVGVLLVKNLILLDPDDGIPLSHMKINLIPTVSPKMPLFELLNKFQEGRSHMAIIREDESSPNASIRSLPPTRRHSTSSSASSDSTKSFKLTRFLGFGHDSDSDTGLGENHADQPTITVTPPDANGSPDNIPSTKPGKHGKHGKNGKHGKSGKPGSPESPKSPPELPESQAASLLAPTAATTTASVIPGRIVGIITLEDVLEELIQEEIYDEHDVKKLAALTVKLDAVTGDRYILASHRVSVNPGDVGRVPIRRDRHRRRDSDDTTRSWNEAEERKAVIREQREDEERKEREIEDKEIEARKLQRALSAEQLRLVGANVDENVGEGGDGGEEEEDLNRAPPGRLRRWVTDPGMIVTDEVVLVDEE